MKCQIKGNSYFAPNGKKSALHKDLEAKVGREKAGELFVLAYTPSFMRKNPTPFNSEGVSSTKYTTGFADVHYKPRADVFTGRKTGEIELELITTPRIKDRGQGHSKQALKEFLAYTDSLKKDVYLTVAPRDKTTTEKGLIQFYKDNGFVQQGLEMIRYRKNTKFDPNGEVKAFYVLQEATAQNEATEPLNFEEREKVQMMMTEYPNIGNSDELLIKLKQAFYNDGIFAPTKKRLAEMYNKNETARIINDVSVMAGIKETIERLKNTETIDNVISVPKILKTNNFNALGKAELLNPFIVEQDIIEEQGGIENPDTSENLDPSITAEKLSEYKRVPVITEQGDAVTKRVLYPDAVKVNENPLLLEAVTALIAAPSNVDTSKVESKVLKWLEDIGIQFKSLNRDYLEELENFLISPLPENLEVLEEAYTNSQNEPLEGRVKVMKLDNKDRDLVFLETNKTEQRLFDEMNLLKTRTPNVYHRIERIDFEELRTALKLNEGTSELEAYKTYFNYTLLPSIKNETFRLTDLKNSLSYLKGEFIADFNIAKIKNPTSEFFNKFEITEKGIELKYNDPLSIAQVKNYIANEGLLGNEIAEYSLISKQMENLTDDIAKPLKNKYNNRIIAVNNIDAVKEAKGRVEAINTNTITVTNGTQEFVKVGNQLYELQSKEGNKSIYFRIEKNDDLNYNNLTPELARDEVVNIGNNQGELKNYATVEANYKPGDVKEDFACL